MAQDKSYVIGIDVGGTTVKQGLFDISGEKIRTWEIPTGRENGLHLLDRIADSVEGEITAAGLAKAQVRGVGIGAPGPVDAHGILHGAVNIGWGTFSLEEELEKRLGIPATGGNDANVAALGEMWKGCARDVHNVLMLTLGTGVGGGIIVEDRILTGATGGAGEVGHIHLEDGETEVCGCGGKGCFEQYASATGAVLLMKRQLAASDRDSVLRGREFTCKDIFDAAGEGDLVARKAIQQYGFYLGKGIAILVSVINPEAVVLGGGVSRAGDQLITLLRPSYEQYVFPGNRDVEFRMAVLGSEAGIYGAARLAL